MRYTTFVLASICCFAFVALAEDAPGKQQALPALESLPQEAGADLTRDKRTLFFKKKLLETGLLGLGLGLAKGYKFGYHSSPEVHHVYVPPPPPPVKYVEYVEKPVYLEKPVYVERIVEKPVHVEYQPSWSEPAPAYGPW